LYVVGPFAVWQDVLQMLSGPVPADKQLLIDVVCRMVSSDLGVHLTRWSAVLRRRGAPVPRTGLVRHELHTSGNNACVLVRGST
jgi:hypothetical protein